MIESRSQPVQSTPVKAPCDTTSPLMYTTHSVDEMVNARCTHSFDDGSTSAAAPPSNQLSAAPEPTLSLKRCIPPEFSRKKRNPEVLLFCASGFSVSS